MLDEAVINSVRSRAFPGNGSNRLGTLEWVRATGGRLTPSQRIRLLPHVATLQVNWLTSALAAAGLTRARSESRLEPEDLVPPRSRWASEAEAAAQDLPATLWLHSLRAWVFAKVLARIDGVALDPEVIYVASLVHDLGLVEPNNDACFTLAGAEAALSASVAAAADDTRAEKAADAVTLHVLPGLSIARHGPEAYFLQAGTLLDVVGVGSEKISRRDRTIVSAFAPRDGFRADVTGRWRCECAAVPDGRAAFVRRYGAMLLAARLNPIELSR